MCYLMAVSSPLGILIVVRLLVISSPPYDPVGADWITREDALATVRPTVGAIKLGGAEVLPSNLTVKFCTGNIAGVDFGAI